MRIYIGMATLSLALAACSGGDTSGDSSDAPAAADAPPAPGTAAEDAPDTLATDAADTEITELPDNFQGQWDFATEDCGTGLSEMQLELTADDARFYESTGTFTSLTRNAEGEIVANLAFSGEGETWEETLAFGLNEEGDRLTVTQTDGSMSIRMRCP